MTPFEELRREMVKHQIARRGITDPRVLEAMGKVPRERFVAPDLVSEAYADRPLPIGHGARRSPSPMSSPG